MPGLFLKFSGPLCSLQRFFVLFLKNILIYFFFFFNSMYNIMYYNIYFISFLVPPSKAIIMDERGMEVRGSKVGPVLEGSTLILTCDIIGGKKNQVFISLTCNGTVGQKNKKSPGQKEIVKSNKSISRKSFSTKFHFLQFQKWPKINF